MILTSYHKDNPSLREAIYNGSIFIFPPNLSSLALAKTIRAIILSEFPNEDVQLAEYYHSNHEHFHRINKAKQNITYNHNIYPLLKNVIQEIGFIPKDNWFDLPRLRAITTNLHRIKEAGSVFAVHRDTWYANPEAQINWWIPIFDIEKSSCFCFYPNYWNQPIQNLSRYFNYVDWKMNGGFQVFPSKKNNQQIFPTICEKLDRTHELMFECEMGSILVFSSAHLHATVPNFSQKTRFSIDFRTLHLTDYHLGKGATNLDNFSQGSICEDYLNCENFEKFSIDSRNE
jgi:hypothetical protein